MPQSEFIQRKSLCQLVYKKLEDVATITADQYMNRNGIIYPYNNGLAEGRVNKIKVIKRIMYGKNSFELLKAKVLFHELFHIEFN